MRPGTRVTDVALKFAIMERKLNIHKNEDWIRILGYSNVSQVSRVKNGKTTLNAIAVAALVDVLGIGEGDLLLPWREFARKIGVDEGDIESWKDHRRALDNAADNALLSSIPGTYLMSYMCREPYDIEVEYVSLQRVEIHPLTAETERVLTVTYYESEVLSATAKGTLSAFDGRISILLDYSAYSYLPAAMAFMPTYLHLGHNIFSGIYMDVTAKPIQEIFATRVVLWQVPSGVDLPARITRDHDQFGSWKAVLENSLGIRDRLVARSGTEVHSMLRRLVTWTRPAVAEGGEPPPSLA